MTSKTLFWKKQVEYICTPDKISIQQQLSKKENAQLLPNSNSWAFVRYVLYFCAEKLISVLGLCLTSVALGFALGYALGQIHAKK